MFIYFDLVDTCRFNYRFVEKLFPVFGNPFYQFTYKIYGIYKESDLIWYCILHPIYLKFYIS